MNAYTGDGISRKLTVVSAGLGTPSSTRLLADRLADATMARLSAADIDTEVTVLELREHAAAVTANLVNGFASPDLEAAIETLAGADGAIFSTPIFTTSYSGLFKTFIDVIEPGTLAGLPVLIAATGGTERHSLALDYAIRPLFAYHHAVATPTSVYAATGDWASSQQGAGASLAERIRRAAGELADLMLDSARSQQVRDPFALPPGFSPAASS